MGLWMVLLFSNLLIPGLLILFGWMFRAHAPKKINLAFGYRTKRSMRNEDTWQFAQAEFGKLAWRWGLAELIPALLGMLLVRGRGEAAISAVGGGLCGVLCIPIGVIIWQVERALKRAFDDNGQRVAP